jgi:hypothetical protein
VRRPERRALLVAAVLAATTALAGCAASAPAAAPTTAPTASARPDTAKAAGFQDPAADPQQSRSSARPVRIVIPAIGVDAGLIDLARGADGVLAAPPSTVLDKAGWYAKGTVPGDTGPAVIAGHVDWVDRVAVFHRSSTSPPHRSTDPRRIRSCGSSRAAARGTTRATSTART